MLRPIINYLLIKPPSCSLTPKRAVFNILQQLLHYLFTLYQNTNNLASFIRHFTKIVIILYHTSSHFITHYHTLSHITILHYTLSHFTTLHHTLPHFIALHHTLSHITTLHYTLQKFDFPLNLLHYPQLLSST